MQWTVEPGYLRVRGRFRVVSSAPWRGGARRARTIVNVRVPKSYHEPVPTFFRRFERRAGLGAVVGLLTAVDLGAISARRSRFGTAIVTAGVSNAAFIGTINVILVVTGRPTPGAMVEVVKVVTEAKAAALRRLDVRAGPAPATGTSTDAVVVASEDRGEPWEFCGAATTRGRALGELVAGAVSESLALGDGIRRDRPIRLRLEERGWSPREIAVASRTVPLTDRSAWEARFGLEDAVWAGRLPRRGVGRSRGRRAG